MPLHSDGRAIIEGAMQGKSLNPISLSRWLKERLVDAPINGRILRSSDRPAEPCVFLDRGGDIMTEGWIENGKGNRVWVGPEGVRATVYPKATACGARFGMGHRTEGLAGSRDVSIVRRMRNPP